MCCKLLGSRKRVSGRGVVKSRNYCLEEDLGFGCGSEGSHHAAFHACAVPQVLRASGLCKLLLIASSAVEMWVVMVLRNCLVCRSSRLRSWGSNGAVACAGSRR
jgi:hypothetical protein